MNAAADLRIHRIYHQSLLQTEKSQPEGKRIMPETRFTEFTTLSVDQRVGISRSAAATDDIIFLTYDIKNIIYHSSFFSFFDILRCITTFS